ncbi:MAG: prepilin peptidase, partial [Geobacter sp.]|nr:prepilin peptidase [Geobacter sp.]
MYFPLQFYIVVFVLGAVVGSFLNVCIYRLPAEKSIVFPPSACPLCGYQIRWFDNIPIVSFLLLVAKCRSCKAPISWRYPLVEARNGFLTLLLFIKFGVSLSFLALFIFCSALVVITFIDLDHQIIPDEISLPGIVVGFIFALFLPWNSWLTSLLGILLGGGSLFLVAWGYEKLTGKEGMG